MPPVLVRDDFASPLPLLDVLLPVSFDPDPDVDLLLSLLEPVCVAPELEVFDAVEAVVELGGAAPRMFNVLAVRVAVWYVKSVPVRVSVLLPGELASSPPKDSAQMAVEVPFKEQSKYPVLRKLY